MNLVTSLTVLAPTLAIVVLADARLKREHKRSQFRIGGFLLALALLPAVGFIIFVPGGSLSDLPLILKPKIDYILTLAISPVIGTIVLAVSLIGRGLWMSDRQQRPSGS